MTPFRSSGEFLLYQKLLHTCSPSQKSGVSIFVCQEQICEHGESRGCFSVRVANIVALSWRRLPEERQSSFGVSVSEDPAD